MDRPTNCALTWTTLSRIIKTCILIARRWCRTDPNYIPSKVLLTDNVAIKLLNGAVKKIPIMLNVLIMHVSYFMTKELYIATRNIKGGQRWPFLIGMKTLLLLRTQRTRGIQDAKRKKTSKTKNWTLLCKSFEQSSGYFIRESINICTVSFEFCIHLLCSRR